MSDPTTVDNPLHDGILLKRTLAALKAQLGIYDHLRGEFRVDDEAITTCEELLTMLRELRGQGFEHGKRMRLDNSNPVCKLWTYCE